jgi:protein-S-isoprenylcysteine O-methyltransferase Ste14
MTDLARRAWVALIVLLPIMALLVFVPAGTIRYWQAWVLLLIFGTVSALLTQYLIRNNPALLKRRLKGGPRAEKRTAQKIIMICVSVAFVALMVVPGLDHRFGWSRMPGAVVIAGDVLVLLGFYFIFCVYRVNPFTSATIEVAEDQRVISTGPYAIVRHPMYAGGFLYLLGTPLALGSYWGLLAAAAMMPLLIWRLLDEERFLAANLPGYREYIKKVRYRLVPLLW